MDGQKFRRVYEILGKEYRAREYLEKSEYVPVVKDRDTGKDMRLTDYAEMCVPKENSLIYARPLEKGVKVFTSLDKTKYMPGEPGDYLAVSGDDLSDIYVVEKGHFGESYVRL